MTTTTNDIYKRLLEELRIIKNLKVSLPHPEKSGKGLVEMS